MAIADICSDLYSARRQRSLSLSLLARSVLYLRMPSDKLIEIVDQLIAKGEAVKASSRYVEMFGDAVNQGMFSGFRSASLSFIADNYGTSHPFYSEFNERTKTNYLYCAENGVEILKSIKLELANSGIKKMTSNNLEGLEVVLNLCERFHKTVRQLRARHDNRPTLDVTDEYDVQDLMHALLYQNFDDIEAEDHTPNHAGSSSRMDFGLRDHDIVIETKMTRPTLKNKQIGDELIIDTARYQSCSYCKHLVCFVYDPNGYINNPTGLEKDLSGQRDNVFVTVLVRPKH